MNDSNEVKQLVEEEVEKRIKLESEFRSVKIFSLLYVAFFSYYIYTMKVTYEMTKLVETDSSIENFGMGLIISVLGMLFTIGSLLFSKKGPLVAVVLIVLTIIIGKILGLK